MKALTLSILLLLLALTGCATNPVTGEQDIVFMSEEQEIDIGRKSHAEVLQAYGAYDDPELQRYVDRIGKRLAAKSHRPELIYRFTVLDSKDVNAFALPGGYIYITRGLIAYLNDEASLAAVLGHEIGHVTARHSVQQYSAAQMTSIGATLGAIFVPGMNNAAAGQLVNVLGTAALRGYGREHELEADRLGAVYMARSGYDPERILDVLGVLKDQSQFAAELARAEGREPASYHGLFASHPDNDTRLQEIVGTATSLQTEEEPVIGRDQFLQLIDGMVYGDSAREGIVRGNTLYHADLGFALQFPPNWRIDNKPSHVIAMAPDGGAQLMLQAEDLGKRVSPREYLLGRLQPSSISDERTFQINGLPAYTMRSPINTQSGNRPARLTTLFFRDKAYTLIGISKNDLDEYDAAFLDSARSFHKLTSNEEQLARPLRLSITRPEAETSYADLARRSPLEHFAEQRLRLLNGDYPDGGIQPGRRLKVVQ